MSTEQMRLKVCAGTDCATQLSYDVRQALEKEVARRDLADRVVVESMECQSLCEQGPVVQVEPDGTFYRQVRVEDAPRLVEQHVVKGQPVEDLAFQPPAEEERAPRMAEVEFFKHQRLVVLRHRGLLDPESIDEYIGLDGYQASAKALLEMSPQDIIDELKKSGLRGRGGAGFPTGVKWQFCNQAPGNGKYMICNADEGDPGAFMDRSVLEGDPHAVLEGMTIASRAIGASEGIVYCRDEYPLAVKRLHLAIKQAEEYGLLGDDIMGSGHSFRVRVVRGGGAFVCGEETALIASIEGRPGRPRPRPPFPAQKGLWEKPTVINNVETLANVPAIIQKGGEWYASLGTDSSKGTKVFALVGKVNNTGLVEVPMGISVRQIVFDVGGGIPGGRKFKAVQTGGPSGGCIPEPLLELPVDYEELAKAGSIIGSGGLIVMDETSCMVDVARYFLTFLMEESCGKCTPCREGVLRMHELLTDITEGRGTPEHLELLEELALAIKDSALCGLGQTAPNSVLSTLRYFRHEYEAHIKYKKCPAAVCRKLISSGCQHTCPVGQDVPAYVALIARGEFLEAAEVIRKKNPLPGVCGRVCHHPCESRCALGYFGDPVAIHDLKRFAMDQERARAAEETVKPVTPKYEKVAIVGSGPAGLAAAQQLARQGYRVTIFEALPVAGGMLAVGIPRYRLPREVLDYDIHRILALGVELKTNTRIGKDLTLEDLKKQDYKAILLAVGLHKSRPLPIEGVELDGVLLGVEFLREAALERPVTLGKSVAIIGGGNVAIDCARTALRLGAEKVQMAFLEPREAMLAHAWDIEEALDESIIFHPAQGPKRILGKNGRVAGLELIQCLSIFDKDGKFNPTYEPGTETVLEADTIIISIGQMNDFDFLAGAPDELQTTRMGTLTADRDTLMTEVPGVFTAGDILSGPETVSGAMGTGQTAAESIHRYLRGLPLEREYKVTRPLVHVEPLEYSDEELEQLAELKRRRPPELAVESRTDNFEEVRGCLGEQAAIEQAKRCVRCDLEVLKAEAEEAAAKEA